MATHLVLVGLTASGKSAVALDVARRIGREVPVEIVSIDSMAVYRHMDVGTAKPPAAARAEVPHHLLDIADPSEDVSVQGFQAAAHDVLDGIDKRAARAVLVGGTGLYVSAVIDGLCLPGRYPAATAALEDELAESMRCGQSEPEALLSLHGRLGRLDPAAAARIEPTNRRRILRALEVTLGSGRPFSACGPGIGAFRATGNVLVGLRHPPCVQDRRIAERVREQVAGGWPEEVAALLARPEGMSRTARQALGYREIAAYIDGRSSLDETVAAIVRRTRTVARRQWAWFRRDPRIRWIDPADGAVDRIVELWSAAWGREGRRGVAGATSTARDW